MENRIRQLESERDALEEKLGNHQMMIKELQKESQTQKIRKEGRDTIAKLLQETRQDLLVSQKRNKVLDIAIHNLQSRLSQNGLNANVELEDNEVYIPGPSKQVMDNLVKENARLRSLTRGNGDPEEIHQLRQQIQEYEDEILKLRDETTEYREQLSASNTILQASESEKDRVISELQMRVEKLHEENKKQEMVRVTLAEESTQLRRQLSDVAVTCQQMALKMEERVKSEREVGVQQTVVVDNSAEMAKVKEEYRQLLEMNQRWKFYNDQREAYVQKLQLELQAAKMTEGTKKNMESILIASRQKLESVLLEKQQLQNQLTRGDEDMKTIQEAFSSQGEELRKTMQELEQIRAHGTPHGHDIDALKAQIDICTEDFESERKDREKAQTRISELEEENQNLRREINYLHKELQQRASSVAPQRPVFQSMHIPSKEPHNFNQPNFGRYNIEPELRLNARGCSSRKAQINPLVVDVADSPASVVEDGVPSRVDTAGRQVMDKGQKKLISRSMPEVSVLQCPKCKKEYESDQHNELLEHIDICC